MKDVVIIRKNNQDNTYTMTINDNNPVVLKTQLTHGKLEVKLPENPSGRQFVMCNIIDASPDGYTVPERITAPRVLNTKKPENYLTDEEKAIIADIMAKATERMNADIKKELTPEEKLRAQIAKLEAKLAGMKNKEDAE